MIWLYGFALCCMCWSHKRQRGMKKFLALCVIFLYVSQTVYLIENEPNRWMFLSLLSISCAYSLALIHVHSRTILFVFASGCAYLGWGILAKALL